MGANPVPLGTMLESLGTNLIDVIAGRLNSRSTVQSVSIYDPFDLGLQLEGAVILGVGVVGNDAVEELMAFAIEQRATAVVLREPVTIGASILRSASDASLVVLGVIPGVDWSQVATSLSRALEQPVAERGVVASPFSDLSATDQLAQLAGSLADLLDAPVTIEDTNSRVLAFSGNQNEGDDCRKETILHREVPKVYREQMRADGIFAEVYSAPGPMFFDSLRLLGHSLSRSVVRVVSGKVILGSIWIAVPERLSAADDELVRRTAGEVARVLEQVRFESGRENARRRILLGRLLAGGREADDAASRTGLGDSAFCLIVIGLPGQGGEPADDGSDSQQLLQVADSLNLHLLSHNKNSVATVWGSEVLGVLPLDERSPDSFVMQVAEQFVDRSRRRPGLHVVVSPIVTRASDLGAAKDDALRTLHVVGRASRRWPAVSRISRTEDAVLDAILMEARDRLMENWSTRQTPVRRLVDYDRLHRTDFVPTLDAHFSHFGAINQAAASIHVHPNTFRYRLKRLHEISGIDVADDESRFRAMLELRLLDLGPSGIRDPIGARSAAD